MSDVKHSVDPDADAIATLADAHYKRCRSDHRAGPGCALFDAWLALRKPATSLPLQSRPTS